jgi:hypothetical protein
MRIIALLLILFSAAGAALAPRGGVVLTKNEVRRMAPETVARRIFGELGPLMLPVADRGEAGVRPTRPLRRLFFYTLPHGANIAGMCRTELMVVEFEPAGPLAGADTPVRPRRITSAPAYFVRDRARLRAGDPNEDEAEDDDRIDAACAAIDPRRAHIIRAQHEYQLGIGLQLLLDLAEAARAGRALVPLDCSSLAEIGTPLTDTQCLAEFARLGLDAVVLISPCDPPAAIVCHRLFVGGYQVDLGMTPNNQRLARARIDALIVVADRMID